MFGIKSLLRRIIYTRHHTQFNTSSMIEYLIKNDVPDKELIIFKPIKLVD